MKVISKENIPPYITKGKIYKVVDERDSSYWIIDNRGEKVTFYKSRFVLANCEFCETRKCNSCSIKKETKC